ncbi:MAG: hypothetical protein COU33_04855, partial [Candidatus Magasanikbacteria bacterium CG10_big_fil_rev_8_21_14_0_10_43_6]
SLNTAKNLGITSLSNTARYGLTLVLGGGEVSLLEMTNAYATFANEGIRTPHHAILSVESPLGEKLAYQTENPYRVLAKNIALQINSILSDNKARTPAFGAASPLYFPGYDVAAKTGTTNDYRDAWVIGYTPNISVGAWAGNNDNHSMDKRVAGYIIAPLWNSFMQYAITTRKQEFFDPPPVIPQDIKPVLRGIWQGSATYTIDTISGKLATEYTPKETKEERVIPNVHSILH